MSTVFSFFPVSAMAVDHTLDTGLNLHLGKYGIAVRDVSSYLTMPQTGGRSAEDFQRALNYYNDNLISAIGQAVVEGSITDTARRFLEGNAKGSPRYDQNTDVYRIWDNISDGWFVDSTGHYPYCRKAEWEAYLGQGGSTGPGNTPAMGKVLSTNKWLDVRSVDTKNIAMVTKDNLGDMVRELCALPASEGGRDCTMYKMTVNGTSFYAIMYSSGTAMYLYCTSTGKPYMASYEPAMIDQDINYNTQVVIKNEDNSTTNTENNIDLSRPIDLSNGTFTVINENGDKITLNMDSLNFNFDDRSYTVNAYDVDYDEENNYYIYNYYTYTVQNTYNNTYVTYIGSTAEYQPVEYELYYELPDGRSSADLTEADVAGLSFQFHDVVNYKRSATDVSLRALYHFDGDTDDASFFSKEDSFTWNKGASLTYMESNNFGGALYLDEKEHQFTLTLPSALATKDFTLQWRYYQNSATTSTHANDNYVQLGTTKVLGWSEQSLYTMCGSTANPTGLSVGTWQELAIIRSGNTLYFYHNGVRIGSASTSEAFSEKIIFYFGANSKAYAMIDELRVTNFAVAKSGAAYSPTVVPYDTNSVLVLPDSADPVADEYWSFDKTIPPKLSIDFTVGGKSALTYDSYEYNGGNYYWNVSDAKYGVGTIMSSPGYQFYYTGSSYQLTRTKSGEEWFRLYNSRCQATGSLFCISLEHAYQYGTLSSKSTWLPSSPKYYTASVVTSDGTVHSVTAYMGLNRGAENKSQSFSWGTLSLGCLSHYDDDDDWYWPYLRLSVDYGKSLDIIYVELVEGEVPNTGHEFVTAIYDKNELQANTAAIQTDIPVKGYTVGGVRPTFPVRGDVWFPVESNRISGVYIYNGRSWEQVNARWWTGSRWIPIYAFDIVTLQDMWDVNGADGDKLQPTISSEYAFWNWWQKEWTDFRGWLSRIWGDGSSGSGPGGSGSGSSSGGFWDKLKDTIGNGLLVLIEGLFALVTTVLEAIIRLVIDLLSFIFGFVTETVIGGIASFFSSFTGGPLFDPFKVEGPDGEVSAALPEGIAAVFAFFSGVILALPGELRGLLIFGVAALILLSVFKFVKS